MSDGLASEAHRRTGLDLHLLAGFRVQASALRGLAHHEGAEIRDGEAACLHDLGLDRLDDVAGQLGRGDAGQIGGVGDDLGQELLRHRSIRNYICNCTEKTK